MSDGPAAGELSAHAESLSHEIARALGRQRRAGRVAALAALSGAFLLALALVGCGLDLDRPSGARIFRLTEHTPLPRERILWGRALEGPGGLEACTDCVPVLWEYPSGAVSLAGVGFDTFVPPPLRTGAYAPAALEAVQGNYLAHVTHGFDVGDTVCLELAGSQNLSVYSFQAGPVDTLRVVGGHAWVMLDSAAVLEGQAELEVAAGVDTITLGSYLSLVRERAPGPP